MDILLKILMRLVICFAGGLEICSAIEHFKSGHYYWCGIYIMLAIWMAAMLFDTYKN